MKELSIEQKAKAYEQAIKRAKAMISVAANQEEIYNSVITIFPELAESEDEKIRKALISFLKSPFVNENITDEKVTPWIAWLEKQGEQKPLGFNIGDEITVNGQICKVVAVEQKPAETEKGAKGNNWEIPNSTWNDEDEINLEKAIWYVENPAPMVAKDSMLVEWLKNLRGRVQLQPKVGWSQEDEDNINDIRGIIYENCRTEDASRLIEWLMSLKPQPKQEWSEYDEHILEEIISFIPYHLTAESYTLFINWLKSLRPQNMWKPSAEQLEALDSTTENCAYSEYQDCLRELIEQLKKLR